MGADRRVGSPRFETRDSERQEERKRAQQSQNKPKKIGLPQADGRRYLQTAHAQTPRHSPELLAQRSETPYEGIL